MLYPPLITCSDCSQLVKANSIEGCKKNGVKIVYTMWSNLHKTKDMQVGAIGFHKTNAGAMKYYTVEKKDNAIVNRLNKNKVEKDVQVLVPLSRLHFASTPWFAHTHLTHVANRPFSSSRPST